MDPISIYYQNVRSIRGKLHELYLASLNCDYDVIILVETWLSDDILNSEILNENYVIYRNDRNAQNSSKSIGGGVLIAVAKRLHSSSLYSICPSNELIWVSINVNINHVSVNLHLCAIYLPPPVSPNSLELMVNDLNNIMNESQVKEVILVGDFNLPSIVWVAGDNTDRYTPAIYNDVNSNLGHTLVDFMSFNSLTQFNLVHNANGKILDLILSNISTLKVMQESQALTKVDTHHPPLIITIDCQSNKPLKTKPFIKLNFAKGDYTEIEKRINDNDWDTILTADLTVDVMTDIFKQKLCKIIDDCIPKKKYKNGMFPPWYSMSLIKIIKEKDKFRRKAKMYNNPRDVLTFELLRRRSHTIIDRDYSKYIKKIEYSLLHNFNVKSFWSYI